MANHPSALKRHRQSVKRQARNSAVKARLRRLVRGVRSAIGSGDSAAARTQLAVASQALDKAVTKGVLHRNNASRRIARLTQAVGRLDAGSAG